jgi:superoxide reductase
MNTINEIYVCEKCNNTVEITIAGCGALNCCGNEMKKYEAKTADQAIEKHVPVIESIDNGTLIKVGSTAHPMEDDHYICWIEIINGSYVNRKNLAPGEKPEAAFYVKSAPGMIVREFCNKHGLWEYTV